MRDDETHEDLSSDDLVRLRSRHPTHLLLSATFAAVGGLCLALAWAIASAEPPPAPMPEPTPSRMAEREVPLPNGFPDIPVRKVKAIPIHVPGAKLPIVERETTGAAP